MEGRGPDEEIETLQPARPPRALRVRVPGLTVVLHPAWDRVGDQARLPQLRRGQVVALSRGEPSFTTPQGAETGGLADPGVSRRSIRILAAPDGGLTVDASATPIVVGGEALAGARVLSAADLERGVFIELADRIVLLLHLLGEQRATPDLLGMVGEHERIEELRGDIRRTADLDVPVLIRGETGTGKELVARAIHQGGPRAHGPFVSVNVSAIPPSTAASELFGHSRGAFTGADAAHRGYFEQADGGTLFLDEIGAIPPAVQPMLLRALESLEIQPLGSTSAHRVDVRLIAATDENLEAAIAEGAFRAAVLHRLEGYQLLVPPLRERREDFGRLLRHFLRAELTATGELHRLERPHGAAPPWLPASLIARLAQLPWPGNVRQLRNVVRQLCISSRGLRRARVDTWLERLLGGSTTPASEPPPVAASPATDDEVRAALRTAEFRVGDAALALGVSRSALYARIRTAGLARQAKDLSRAEIEASRRRCAGELDAMSRELEVSRRALAARIRELDEGA